MIRLLLVFALLSVSLMPAYAQSAPGVIDMHAYTKADCSQDDSAGFQAAINAWQTGAQGGKLELGSGCWILSHPVKALLPNDAGIFGTFEGDGVGRATINCSAGVGRCLEFDQFWYANISGFSMNGGGNGQPNAGSNHDFGLVLANGAQDLGTCCGTITNVNVSGFARCFMFGDDQAPLGAAAEFVLTQVSGNNCGGADDQYSQTNGGLHCGGDPNDPNPDELARYGGGVFWFGSYNTLDFVENRPGSVSSGTVNCMGYGGPGQVKINGGGSTDNQHELNLRGDCTLVTMDTYRAEGGSNADGHPTVLAGGCPDQKLMIVGSQLRSTSVYSPVSISLDNGDGHVYLVNNNLVGQVQTIQGIQTIWATNNTILTQGVDPFGFSDPNCCGAMRLYTAGNRNASNIGGMWVTDWWPDNLQGYWMYPPNSQPAQANPTPTLLPDQPKPTSTPAAPTATPLPAATATPAPTSTPTSVPTVDCTVHVAADNVARDADSVDFDIHVNVPSCS